MHNFNLEIFKTLILNFAYVHSKRTKLGTFILFPKYQFVYTNKRNSPPIRQFPPLSIFGHAMCHLTVIKPLGTRKPQDLLLGKNSCCSRSPSERYCQSFICSEHTFNPGLKPLRDVGFTKIQQTFKTEMNALRRENKRPQQTVEDARITTWVSSSKWGKT